jgi:phage-related protein
MDIFQQRGFQALLFLFFSFFYCFNKTMSSAFYSFINSVTNSITSRYDIKQQVSSAGLWKIYQGVRKTTGKKVSLFVCYIVEA